MVLLEAGGWLLLSIIGPVALAFLIFFISLKVKWVAKVLRFVWDTSPDKDRQ